MFQRVPNASPGSLSLRGKQRRGQVAQVVERSPEKAGVGGSTPSLATIIPKELAESRLALPVRSQSAIFRRDPVQHSQRRTAKEAQGSRTNAGRTHIGWQVKERLL